jgi:hypothetical protein
MTVDEFIDRVKDDSPPASPERLAAFEVSRGCNLPEDYRYFLSKCNGGHLGGRYGINVVGGLRPEPDYSLEENARIYGDRLPENLLWIMEDPFGNPICLEIGDENAGRVFHWSAENEPIDGWDGDLETADNVILLGESFTEFVAGLPELEEM